MKTFYTRVVGVTFENRQDTIATLSGNEPCRLVPEPQNEYDKNAIGVHVATPNGVKQIGYLKKSLPPPLRHYLKGNR